MPGRWNGQNLFVRVAANYAALVICLALANAGFGQSFAGRWAATGQPLYNGELHKSILDLTQNGSVLKGKLTLRLGKKTLVAGPGSAFAVPTGTVHRFESHHGRVTLIEVSTTELDDVVRLQDDYGRTRRK